MTVNSMAKLNMASENSVVSARKEEGKKREEGKGFDASLSNSYRNQS